MIILSTNKVDDDALKMLIPMHVSQLDDSNENTVITTMKLVYFVTKGIFLLLHIKNCVIWLCLNRSIHYIKVDKEE